MTREEAIKKIKSWDFLDNDEKEILETLIPELKESEGERIRKAIIEYFNLQDDNTTYSFIPKKDILAWLEKQGEKQQKASIWKHWKDGIAGNGEDEIIYLIKDGYTYSLSSCLGFECDYIELSELDKLLSEKQGEQSIYNTPSKEIILAIWDLGNEWKELTNGSISTEYGTQLEYIQKHWNESEYYLSENQVKKSQKTPSEMLKEYFANTSKEQLDKNWEELKELNDVGITIDEYNEPKFHEDDWIVNNGSGGVYQVTEIKDDEYCLWPLDAEIMGYLSIIDVDNEYHLWTIQDAKDGDVLCYKDEVYIYKHDIKNCTKKETSFGGMVYYCCYDGKRFITDSMYSLTEKDKDDIHPATKEQRDLLFQKMREAGYDWNVETKEVKL